MDRARGHLAESLMFYLTKSQRKRKGGQGSQASLTQKSTDVQKKPHPVYGRDLGDRVGSLTDRLTPDF